MDAARGRRQFCHALAADQIGVLAQPAGRRTDFREPRGQGRARHLQRRYWEHTVRDETDFERHVDYIHINPVKHGLVARVRDWPFSSFHRMVKLGIYPEDWAGVVIKEDADLANPTAFVERDDGFREGLNPSYDLPHQKLSRRAERS